MDDMKVAQTEYSEGFTDDTPDGHSDDWRLIQAEACFIHKEACEFIVHLGAEVADHRRNLRRFRKNGLSKQFREECSSAFIAGYKYLCFYA